jgi:hypothetical protein
MTGWAPVLAAVCVAGLGVPARADHGSGLRAVGWFKGKADITPGQIKCEIPTVTSAIGEGAFALGLWNTFGVPTLYYPDINNPFANPCGVWLQLRNDLFEQAITVDRVRLRYRVRGAWRFRRDVGTQRGFPVACRPFRREIVFVGARLNPAGSTHDSSGSGAPNVAFLEMLPLVSPQVISCLRAEYAWMSPEVFTSLSLVIRATVHGTSDAGARMGSNGIGYTLDLRHTCGNGRVDDGEACDPGAPNACAGACVAGVCSQDERIGCTTHADCVGACLEAGSPSECTCAY